MGEYAAILNPGNFNLTFEKTQTLNLGLDFGLFDRLTGALDVYSKNSKSLLNPKTVNASYGVTTRGNIIRVNDGEISNKGITLNLRASILKDSQINWDSNLNFSYNKNRVVSFGGNEPNRSLIGFMRDVSSGRAQLIGHSLSSKLKFKWAGLDNEGNPQIYDENGNKIGFKNGNLWPTRAGLAVTKTYNAPYFGGWTNNFNYKKFSLSFQMTYKFGHVFDKSLGASYPYNSQRGGVFVTAFAFHKDVENAWKKPGDENITNIPALPRTSNPVGGLFREQGEHGPKRQAIFVQSDLGVLDAAHIRLRDITLGYTLPQKLTDKIGFNNVNLTFQMRNLGLLWKANNEGLDPESVPFSGRASTFYGRFTNGYRPGIRTPITYTLGVNVNF